MIHHVAFPCIPHIINGHFQKGGCKGESDATSTNFWPFDASDMESMQEKIILAISSRNIKWQAFNVWLYF
jgi:hypothetical protein